MQPKSDAQLLREYAEQRAEGAFAELVIRHTNLVYSAALRHVESVDLAAEISQQVCIGLAQKAHTVSGKLNENASLAGWLCRSARNLSLNLRRDEFRRHSRETQAMARFDSPDHPHPDWALLRPALEAAMSELNEADYDAIVLRFFKNQDMRAVGQALGVTDDTAQKRVSRALQKLQDILARQGITTSAASLSMVLSANAVQAAPVGLTATISTATAALHGSTFGTATTATITKAIIMTTTQKIIIAATAILLCGAATVVVNNRMKDRTSADHATVVNLDDYVGRFEMPGRRIDLQKKDSGVAVFIDGQPAFVAYPSSTDKFVSRDHGSITELTFVKDAAGRPVQFTLVRDGRKLGELKRPENF